MLHTMDGIPIPEAEDLMVQAKRRALTETGLKHLRAGNIYVYMNAASGKLHRNDSDQAVSGKTRFVRTSNITELVLSNVDSLSHPWQSLLQSPSLVLAKFLLFPEQFTKPCNRVEDLGAFFKPEERSKNTSTTEVDSAFPCLDRNTRAVVIGLTGSIREHLGGRENYYQACQDVFLKITGRKNTFNFPVLAAVDHQSIVTKDGTKHVVDFYKETALEGAPMLPFVLTSFCELKSRIQVQYLEILYRLGVVKLHPEPVDGGALLFRLADDDPVSNQMGLNRSTSIMYSLSVLCCVCAQAHHWLWRPGIEAEEPDWLDGIRCKTCGNPVISRSCFVIKSSSGKLDPSTVRKIKYSLPLRSQELPQYEHLCHLTNGANLRLHLRQDVSRKNFQGVGITATLLIPVVYNMPFIEGFDTVEDSHCLMNVFIAGFEHVLPMMFTRVKMSMTCNKSVLVKTRRAPPMEKLAPFGNLFQRHSEDSMKVYFPSTYATKRFGVELRDAYGNVQLHSASVVTEPSMRMEGRKVPAVQTNVESTMYSCQHFLGAGMHSDENNFTKYGVTVVAGFVFNCLAQQPEQLQQLLPSDFHVRNVISTISYEDRMLNRKCYMKADIARCVISALRSELAEEREFSSKILRQLIESKDTEVEEKTSDWFEEMLVME